MKTLSAQEVRKETGATYRQIDYWSRMKIIDVIGVPTPGSGKPREFDPAIIPRVKLLVRVSRALGTPSPGILKRVWDNCEQHNNIYLGDDIFIVWDGGKRNATDV